MNAINQKEAPVNPKNAYKAYLKAKPKVFEDIPSVPRRMADFLFWCADEYGKAYIDLGVVYQIGVSQGRPGVGDAALDYVRQRLGRVRDILEKDDGQYRRGLDTVPGLGVRCTVDDEDTARHCLIKKGKRVQSAVKSYTRTAAIINVAKIPSRPDTREIRGWLSRDVKDVVKLIGPEDFLSKLLPPARDDEEK